MACSACGSEDGAHYMKQRASVDQEIEDISPPFKVAARTSGYTMDRSSANAQADVLALNFSCVAVSAQA